MKKKIVFLGLAFLCSCLLWAGDFNDVGFAVGLGTWKVPEKELSMSYSMDVGLSRTWEVEFWGISDIVPVPGKNTMLGVDLVKALNGDRSTGSKISGTNFNMYCSLGGFYRLSDKGVGLTVGLIPLSIGSPSLGKREKFFTTRAGWDFVNRRLTVTFSLADYEIYAKGRSEDFMK